MKKNVLCYLFAAFFVLSPGLLAMEKGSITTLDRVQVEDAYTPQVLGLFIGIDSYSDPLWHNLKYPAKDVADMVSFFENSDALALDYHMVLTQKKETTRDYILNHALDAFEMKNSSEKDVVIAYISGHGTLAHELFTVMDGNDTGKRPVKRPYVVTSDTLSDKVADSAIALDKITAWFDKLRSRRKILILDLCHSGLGKSQISPDDDALIRSEKGILYIPMEDSWASMILSACPMGGTSYEDDKLQNSVYTHFLIEGMEKGDLNGDGAVSISEAHNYAIDQTRQYTWEHKGIKQIPTAYSRILGKDPVFVSGKRTTMGTPVLFSYNSANAGVELYVDNIYQGVFPKGFNIEKGERDIQCRYQGRTILKEKIVASPGHEYILSDLYRNHTNRHLIVTADVGFRLFSFSDIDRKLLPDEPAMGTSIYVPLDEMSHLAYSVSANYSYGRTLSQFSTTFGLMYKRSSEKSLFFLGPDVMFLSFNYDPNDIENIQMDKHMRFLCPGAKCLFVYEPWPNVDVNAGIGSYWMVYNMDNKKHHIMINQPSISVGFSF